MCKQENIINRPRPSARDFSTGSRSYALSQSQKMRRANRSILALRRTKWYSLNFPSDRDKKKRALIQFDQCSPADRDACNPYHPYAPPLITPEILYRTKSQKCLHSLPFLRIGSHAKGGQIKIRSLWMHRHRLCKC